MSDRTSSAGAAVARRLLDAIVTRDFDSLDTILAADVWMRALLPREVVETHSAAAATEVIRGWFAAHEALEVVSTEQHTVEGREFLAYNLRVRPDWAPDVWHIVEQSAYCRVADDQRDAPRSPVYRLLPDRGRVDAVRPQCRGRARPGMTGSSVKPRKTRPSPWPHRNSESGTASRSSGNRWSNAPSAS